MVRMKVMVTAAAAGLVLLAGGCGRDDKAERHQADRRAASFTPPSVMSRLDFGSSAARRFRTMDRNGDDVLTKDEFPSTDTRLLRLDRNHDGQITESEFSEGSLAFFDRMDLNQDGTVTSEERRTAEARPRETPQASPAATPAPGE
jgi:hypothetical protein